MKHKVSNVGNRTWTAEDDAVLTELHLDGVHYRDIAAELGVTISSVEARRMKLGLPSPTQIQRGKS